MKKARHFLFFVFCCLPAVALAEAKFLECRADGFPPTMTWGLTIDLDGRTVVFTDTENVAEIDMNGVKEHKAEITEELIRWKVTTKRAGGGLYTAHYSLSRYTGRLSDYDDGMRDSSYWNCTVVAKPRERKF